jgi:Na+/proline symporter
LVGLVIASLFANTMSMTSSDINTISAVITRDILPNISRKFTLDKISLRTARITTFIFTLMTIIVALQYESFGGILGLIISWFGALVGPIAVPMLFGVIPAFKSCGPVAAISSMFAGLLTFIITKNVEVGSLALQVSLPLIVSTLVFITIGFTQIGTVPEKVKSMLQEISKE